MDSYNFESMQIHCHLNELLEAKDMTLTDLSARVGVSVVNLSKLKNNHAKAIRFSTLVALCHVLDCEPGDLLTLQKADQTSA